MRLASVRENAAHLGRFGRRNGGLLANQGLTFAPQSLAVSVKWAVVRPLAETVIL